MTEAAEGLGSGHPPTIVVENNPAALSAALEASLAAYTDREPQRQIAAATERVRKAQESLDAAQATLAAITAEWGEAAQASEARSRAEFGG